MKRITKSLALVLATLTLNACMGLGPVANPHINYFVIDAMPVLPADRGITKSQMSQLSLTVMPMTAESGFDTNAMLYLHKPYQLAPYSQNRWLAPPSSMLSALLLTSLQETHALRAVVSAASVGNTDLILNTQLLALYQDLSSNPGHVVCKVQISLTNKAGKVLASDMVSANVLMQANNPEEGVAATNLAVKEILAKINAFVLNSSL